MAREDLIQQLRAVAVWTELPLIELLGEFAECGLGAEATLRCGLLPFRRSTSCSVGQLAWQNCGSTTAERAQRCRQRGFPVD
mmetsp:Transcript_3999/g.9365  ORF Transcript_3999/g.9365 Transcript_3999/m.9365 type:complete len:82 (+) Transcript_3999:378-623(+)